MLTGFNRLDLTFTFTCFRLFCGNALNPNSGLRAGLGLKSASGPSSSSSSSSSLYLLRNIVKHDLIDKRQRAGRIRQADAVLTADQAYKHKNIKTLNTLKKVIEVNMGENVFKKSKRIKLYCRWQWIPKTDNSPNNKKYLRAVLTQRERHSLCAWPP